MKYLIVGLLIFGSSSALAGTCSKGVAESVLKAFTEARGVKWNDARECLSEGQGEKGFSYFTVSYLSDCGSSYGAVAVFSSTCELMSVRIINK
jgi:hypothetical protein